MFSYCNLQTLRENSLIQKRKVFLVKEDTFSCDFIFTQSLEQFKIENQIEIYSLLPSDDVVEEGTNI